VPVSATHAANVNGRETMTGDGIREVHSNSIEGIWTGLRNFLRLFRGVNKEYLSQYTAVFEVGHDRKEVTPPC
jgi:hypothetical protein